MESKLPLTLFSSALPCFCPPSSPLLLPCNLFLPKFPTPISRYTHAALLFSSPSNCSHSFHKKRRFSSIILRATRRESPYDVLGVSPSATPAQIKRAYRKLALKFHPDVNKEANAQETFMRIKHAYNTLLTSEGRRNYDYGSRTSGYSYSTAERSRSKNADNEEGFYGFGNFLKDVQITIEDFFRDVQTEFKNWEESAGSQGKPKSLWEELADIGEEFVEFLEKELNITDPIPETENSSEDPKKDLYETKSDRREDDVKTDSTKESNIEDNIDEIEATLAQLKRELGLQ